MIDHSLISVLIIDDEATIRLSLIAFLEDQKFKVQAAADAEQAMALLATHPFDVAIVDLRLPGMSGDMFIVKAHQISPHLKFLIYTGSANFDLSAELRRIGLKNKHVLYKPMLDLKKLVSAIELLIQDN